MTLEVSGLHAGYATARVLNGVDFTVESGQSVALLGRNGMGKTTLVRAICGLRPPVITAGTITYEGVELTKRPSFQISRAGIAIVPQGRRVFGSLTVTENLTVVPRRRRADGEAWTVERVFEFFPRLAERSKSMARSLSGGEQQMLAMARGMMSNPKILLLDEPSMGLAPLLVQKIFDTVIEIRKQGVAVLLVEQNAFLALQIADYGYVLETGEIPLQGPAQELLENPQVKEAYLG